jgi:putative transposase
MRYIERNPVHAGLVAVPAHYRWSSHRANAFGEADALVTPHPFYYALARTPQGRQLAYRAFCGG